MKTLRVEIARPLIGTWDELGSVDVTIDRKKECRWRAYGAYSSSFRLC